MKLNYMPIITIRTIYVNEYISINLLGRKRLQIQNEHAVVIAVGVDALNAVDFEARSGIALGIKLRELDILVGNGCQVLRWD